ncbi:MAG: hypothetical protein B7Z41_05185, partial [Rhizobiales bacterium 12-66-7]
LAKIGGGGEALVEVIGLDGLGPEAERKTGLVSLPPPFTLNQRAQRRATQQAAYSAMPSGGLAEQLNPSFAVQRRNRRMSG